MGKASLPAKLLFSGAGGSCGGHPQKVSPSGEGQADTPLLSALPHPGRGRQAIRAGLCQPYRCHHSCLQQPKHCECPCPDAFQIKAMSCLAGTVQLVSPHVVLLCVTMLNNRMA